MVTGPWRSRPHIIILNSAKILITRGRRRRRYGFTGSENMGARCCMGVGGWWRIQELILGGAVFFSFFN